MKASREASKSIMSVILSAVENQRGAWGSNAGISSQNHSEGDDAKA